MKCFSQICICAAISLMTLFAEFSSASKVTVFADSTDSFSEISSELAAADSYLHPDTEITPTENPLKVVSRIFLKIHLAHGVFM